MFGRAGQLCGWIYLGLCGAGLIGAELTWAQGASDVSARKAVGATRMAEVSLRAQGWMTQTELSKEHTITEEGKYKGYIQSGPPGGTAWRGVGEVVVDNSGRVFVGLPIWASGAAPRSEVRGEGDKLRIVVVDASKAAAEAKWDFPTQSLARLDLRLAGDAVPLVFAGDKLMRVGADGKTTAELAVPNEAKEYEVWDVTSSRSGRKVRLQLNNDLRILVDARTLAVLGTCHEDADNPTPRRKQGELSFSRAGDNDNGTFTDEVELMSNTEGEFPNTTPELDREKFCQKREKMTAFGAIDFAPSIVDDDLLLAVTKGSVALRAMTGETVGKVLWTRAAPEGRQFETWENSALVSRNGDRVAIRVMRSIVYQEPVKLERGSREISPLLRVQLPSRGRPRTRQLEVEDRIEVLELATGRVVAEVSIQERDEDLTFKMKASYSLSPDGKLLAILQDGVVVVWKIG
jgi:hypothetical protein